MEDTAPAGLVDVDSPLWDETPVDEEPTDEEPTGQPPEDWDIGAHAESYEADPDGDTSPAQDEAD